MRVVLIALVFVAGCAKQQPHATAPPSGKTKVNLAAVDMSKSGNQPTYHRYRSDSAQLPRSSH
jgi:hypothetical protein